MFKGRSASGCLNGNPHCDSVARHVQAHIRDAVVHQLLCAGSVHHGQNQRFFIFLQSQAGQDPGIGRSLTWKTEGRLQPGRPQIQSVSVCQLPGDDQQEQVYCAHARLPFSAFSQIE